MAKKSSLILAATFVLFLGPGLSTARAGHRFSAPAFHRSHVGAFHRNFVHHRHFFRPHFVHPRFRPNFFHPHRYRRIFVRYPYPHYVFRRGYLAPPLYGPYCRPY
ncbi:MAG TPA: hypothetical protein VGL03_10635 [Thermoanaerobaculia bacterium]|jgi:hypothetical protein